MGQNLTEKETMSKDTRDIYPIELIKTGMKLLQQARFSKNEPRPPIRALIVYQIIAIQDGFLPLGRDYKPLGLESSNGWADYDTYPFLVIPKERVNLDHWSGIQKGFTHGYYLFDDSTYPDCRKTKDRYFKMMKIVFGLH